MTEIADITGSTNIVLTCPENTTLVPFQEQQAKIWHRQWIGTTCQNFQLAFSLSPEQIAQTESYQQAFTLHALTLYLSPNARMTQ